MYVAKVDAKIVASKESRELQKQYESNSGNAFCLLTMRISLLQRKNVRDRFIWIR